MVTDFYISLIYKELDGSITPTEKSKLDLWSKNVSNALVKSQIVSVWDLSEDATSDVAIDLDADFDIIKEKIKDETKVIPMPARSRKWGSIAAGAAILVVAVWTIQKFSQVSSELVSHTASQSDQYYMIEDGSEIYLHKGSTFSYSQPMDKKRRVINLQGEAVFHVAHDKNWPLDVVTDNETITVLGTKFHVIEDEKSTKIQLIEGRIAVSDKEGSRITELNKGQSLDRNHQSRTNDLQNNLKVNKYAWQSKRLKFENVTLEQVANDLESAYRASIVIDEQSKKCLLSASFNDKTLDQVMAVISSIHGFEIHEEGEKIIWKGGKCE